MANRHIVKAEKQKNGRWKLVLFGPTQHGHRRWGFISDQTWETKKAADEARRTRVRWRQFGLSGGRWLDREYYLIDEKQTSQ
jgi:hypothetical protein